MKLSYLPISFLAISLAASFTIHPSYARRGNGAPDHSSAAVSSTASLGGGVRFEGILPKSAPINMAADPRCAMQHQGVVRADDVVADSGGGLANVIVFVASGLATQNFEVPDEPVVIQQKGCMYSPHVIAMQANQKLEVLNSDKTAHNIHPTPTNNREWNKFQPPGSPLEETFPREELAIPVRCNLHPWMRSYIAVFNHPFFVVTGSDGGFQLPSLPPGDYTVEAWHEKLGTLTQKVSIGSGETKRIEFVFKNKGAN